MKGDARPASSTVRLLLQLAAVAVVVAVPWLLNQRLIADTLVAQEWVTHTAEVKNLVNEIQSAVRDADRALLSAALYRDAVEYRVQLNDARLRVADRMHELDRVVGENENQRARVGQLQALLDMHVIESDRIIDYLESGERQVARELLEKPGAMEQLRQLTGTIIAEEDRLMTERREIVRERRTRFVTIMNGMALLQLILLALIVALSERQHRRRSLLEAQTREAKSRSDLILNAVRKPIALLDREFNIIQCNPAFRQLYAAEGDTLTGRALTSIGEGSWNDAAFQQILRDVCYIGRELWDYELEQETSVSGRRVLLVNARRMPGTDAKSATVILTANDVTAARGADRQIRDLNDALSSRIEDITEANHQLEAFSYSVSHDLRAPLRHIAAYSEKLQRELDLEAGTDAARYVRVIDESARRMGLLIDELLVHSRLGRGELRSVSVAMGLLVDEVREMLAPETAGRAIDWQVGALPTVRGDASMLRLVWQNLIGNAVKYTTRRDRAIIEIDAQYDAQRCEYVFRVSDNGAGFDMAYADKLFGVFQRLHTADEFPGTGIGLANVRRIVTRHRGRVWAEAEPDRGATFYFALPDRHASLTGEVV